MLYINQNLGAPTIYEALEHNISSWKNTQSLPTGAPSLQVTVHIMTVHIITIQHVRF